ncbi:MAG TPA: amino acid adenylation domain-containing protein [Candidatus Nitrosotenuis sp.]|nr:amino acid adenylation domain-containing protein [Candidatus Nitrosotenuis sp.]
MNRTAEQLPARSLADYLEASARRFPERTAVVDPDGGSLTYAQLDERADRVAGFLAARGVQPGDRVGIVQPKSVDTVAALFGIMKAGAAYVPADWSAPAERCRTILRDCAVRALFVDERCRAVGFDENGQATAPTVILTGPQAEAAQTADGAMKWSHVLAHAPLPAPARPARSRESLAYMLYTSGSTGIPKGVMLTHGNALSFVDWCSEAFQPNENDHFSSHAPLHFDLSVLDIYVSLKHGATLFLITDDLGKNPKELAQFIADRKLTIWYSTPSILSMLAEFGHLERYDHSALRTVLFAGEVFPPKHLRNLVKLWHWPEYYNLYGPTETNVCTFAHIPKPVPEDRTQPYPIGWPCSHCKDLVVDENNEPAAPGEEGLLYISGESVFQGYWNRPKENARAFMERDGVRWYNTGDVVRLDPRDGYIYLGRRDRMVKRRGYRIELGEIESGLYKHPHIREAAAVAVPDPASGVRIIAFLTPRAPEQKPSIVEMKSFCSKHLPAYMIPDQFLFKEALPRTSTDKVNYPALTAEFAPRE